MIISPPPQKPSLSLHCLQSPTAWAWPCRLSTVFPQPNLPLCPYKHGVLQTNRTLTWHIKYVFTFPPLHLSRHLLDASMIPSSTPEFSVLRQKTKDPESINISFLPSLSYGTKSSQIGKAFMGGPSLTLCQNLLPKSSGNGGRPTPGWPHEDISVPSNLPLALRLIHVGHVYSFSLWVYPLKFYHVLGLPPHPWCCLCLKGHFGLCPSLLSPVSAVVCLTLSPEVLPSLLD